jgi:serine/threonine protein kinase
LKDTVSTNSTLKQVKQLKIGDFEIGREIGRGRFGVVKLVRHKKTGLVFAVKMIKKSVAKK